MELKNLLFLILLSIITLHYPSASTATPPIDSSLFRDPLTRDPTAPLHTYPRIIPRGAHLQCTTTATSPALGDIYTATNKIYGSKSIWCTQTRKRCTTFATHGSASVAFCAAPGRAVKCEDLAWVGQTVARYCEDQGRAAGRWIFPATQGTEGGVVDGSGIRGVVF